MTKTQELKVFSNAADIDVDSIPDKDLDYLARAILEILVEIADTPQFKRGFDEWKKKRGENGAACSQ